VILIEIGISIILLSLLICYSKDFIAKGIRLRNEIIDYYKNDKLDEDEYKRVKDCQFFFAVLSSIFAAVLILVFRKFAVFGFPIYAILLAMSWYLPAITSYNSGRLFRMLSIEVCYTINRADNLIYLSLILNVGMIPEEQYWDHYFDDINGEKRSYSVIIGNSKADIMEEFKDFNIKHHDFSNKGYKNLEIPYFVINYNQSNKQKLSKYFDI
jgi:hypothetical protein